ncbi:MAG TPA: 1,4-dihydroxy-2-naphthoate polyprenyltransferase [Thermoanaerobaculia bacterium]|jgi:1,4-dihydroxy-2-naphthoate octaprenyltransferase
MSSELPAPGSFGAWVLASRPPTLAAAFVPVAVGAACAAAAGGLRIVPTLVALAAALWIQIGTNFANDVFDYEKGADTGQRLGPTRAVQAGLLDERQMRRGMWTAFAIAGVGGVYLTWAAGWPLAAIGVVSILAGIAYTGGPFPLGYNGLGDVFVFVFFGFVAVCGTAYASLRAVPELAWWAAAAPGALATNILVVNNVRDRAGDDAAGKRTLVVRFGRAAGVAEYVTMAAVAYAVPPALWLRGLASPWALAPLATLPLAAALTAQLVRREGRPLNATLVGTARLLVLFGVLFAAGLAVSRP